MGLGCNGWLVSVVKVECTLDYIELFHVVFRNYAFHCTS